uniref:F-box protein 4 n=1 Tax=Malurus cyaneus samueli TaxID=2593467 RepID=A0A8C5X4E9_9PASS
MHSKDSWNTGPKCNALFGVCVRKAPCRPAVPGAGVGVCSGVERARRVLGARKRMGGGRAEEQQRPGYVALEAPPCGRGLASWGADGGQRRSRPALSAAGRSRGAGPERLQGCRSIDVQLNIMSFLSPQDLCRLGSTNCYWRAAVQDPLLWRYFLLRDLPSWTSVDWKSLPDVEIFNKAFSEVSDNTLYDYMAVYKRSCPQGRRSLKSSRPRYGAVTSFLQSLVTQAEPRFAMFGPGLEELDDSLVQKMMTCPEILLVAGLPHRQIHGIGSGVSFQFSNNQKFNILTLYSATSVERRRAREEQAATVNKMFYQENSIVGNQQAVHYSVIAQVRKVCEVVDGFIYVANAEAHREHDRQEELARIEAMIDPTLGPPNRPLLILSCVSHIGVKRIPCIYMAHQLQLNLLRQPWMMQDTVAATLDGLLNGIEWLLEETNCKNAQ